jgi:murein hydrolase activator
MRFAIILFTLATTPFVVGGAIAQQQAGEQAALRAAKARAASAKTRAEDLRQEASNAENAVDRLVAQRAVLGAQIDAANAQISAANARLTIIGSRQKEQRRALSIASDPVMRLIGGILQSTSQPAAVMMLQPGSRDNFIHLRAVTAAVEPVVKRRTASLRQAIAAQAGLRAQEMVAIQSLSQAKSDLARQKSSLSQMEGGHRQQAESLSASAAVEYERAIAQGEQARDLVERIDSMRENGELAADLAMLDGPVFHSQGAVIMANSDRPPYILPAALAVVFGFQEQNATGYRERGVRLKMAAGAAVKAPAAGKIIYANAYRSYGRIVIIDHGKGWTSLLTNLNAISVSKGQNVTQGAILGSVGAVMPEIGIELRRNGRPMDLGALLF